MISIRVPSILVLAAIGFMTSTAFPKNRASDAKVYFEYTTHLQEKKFFTLRLKDSVVYFDQTKLSHTDLILSQQQIHDILSVEGKPPNGPCLAGTFRHDVAVDGVEKNEVGCIGDSRFAKLFSSFQYIENHKSLLDD